MVEKETGATYVYQNGELHPTLNYASAVLISGRSDQVFRVAAVSLAKVPRGSTMGIPDAPNSLPPASKQVGLPWSSCVEPGVDASGRPIAPTTLAVAETPTGAQPVGDQALLVKDAKGGATYLIWHGRRHLVQTPSKMIQALYGSAVATPAGTAWLAALPSGVDVAAIGTPNLGQPSHSVPGRTNGDVLVQQTGSGSQYYLVEDDGLLPITQLQMTVYRGVHGDASPLIQAQGAEVANAPHLVQGPTSPDGDLPPTVPQLTVPGGADQLCAVTSSAASPPTLSVGGTLAGVDTELPTPRMSESGEVLADYVVVPAGRVCIVRIGLARTDVTANYFVVTDSGIKYPVANPNVLPQLGYSQEAAVDVPPALVSRLPTGPTLDPTAALQPHTTND